MRLTLVKKTGQAAVFVALVIFSLMLFLALATNMGILVNDKIRMQNTVDLATYSVAYSEAQVLNELVHINSGIAETVAYCRDALVGGYWMSCGCTERHPGAEAIIRSCQAMLDVQIGQFVATSMYDASVVPALANGRATAEANFTGTGNNTATSFMENYVGMSPTARFTHYVNFSMNSGYSGSIPAIGEFEQASIILNYMHFVYCPTPDGCVFSWIAFPETSVDAWFYKDSSDPDIWVTGRVQGTPKKQFLDVAYKGGGYFGASSNSGTDMLYAYAVAKPYEGSVGPTPGLVSSTDREGNWKAGPLYISSKAHNPKSIGMVEEYRARMAGMREDLVGTDPKMFAFLDGGWNPDYFWH